MFLRYNSGLTEAIIQATEFYNDKRMEKCLKVMVQGSDDIIGIKLSEDTKLVLNHIEQAIICSHLLLDITEYCEAQPAK